MTGSLHRSDAYRRFARFHVVARWWVSLACSSPFLFAVLEHTVRSWRDDTVYVGSGLDNYCRGTPGWYPQLSCTRDKKASGCASRVLSTPSRATRTSAPSLSRSLASRNTLRAQVT